MSDLELNGVSISLDEYNLIAAQAESNMRVRTAKAALLELLSRDGGLEYFLACHHAADQLQRTWYAAEFSAHHYAKMTDQGIREAVNNLETAVTIARNDVMRELLLDFTGTKG